MRANRITESRADLHESLLADALAEAVEELGEVPSGHLYTRVMNHLSIEQYNRAIELAIRAGRITKDSSNLLRRAR